ncbi:F-box domain-containing protein [Mycena kentingensis (nom. inval.)]|nr:F-box domain-containing protein [Mycena kentingensis (nom. inval.)]
MSNAALRAKYDQLVAERAKQASIVADLDARLQELRPQLKRIKYCLETLPHEVLSEIFVYCRSTVPDVYMDMVHPLEAPLLLTQICAQWRRVALATPHLWTTFKVVVGEARKPKLAEMAEAWLGRTGSILPLSIFIGGAFAVGEDDSFFDVLQRYAPRVKSLHLRLPVADLLRLNERDWSFPILERLGVSSEVPSRSPPAPDAVTMFHQSPLLRSFTLDTFGTDLSSQSLPLDCFLLSDNAHIVDFAANGYRVAGVSDALHELYEVFRGTFTLCSGADFDTVDPVTHDRIAALQLQCFGTGWDTALANLTLPSLLALTIRGMSTQHVEDTVFEEFLQRSQCTLTALILSSPFLLRIPPPSTFRLLPALTELRLLSVQSTNVSEFFDAYATEPAFLPALHIFVIMSSETAQNNAESSIYRRAASFGYLVQRVVDAFARRRETVPGFPWALESVGVMVDDGPAPVLPEERLEPLQVLKAAGVEVRVGSMEHSIEGFD